MRTIIKQQGATLSEASINGRDRKERAIIKVDNRNIYATISLTSMFSRGGSDWYAFAFIESIVSGGTREDFNSTGVTELFRRDVTEVTFQLHVLNCNVSSRWQLNHWSKE